MNAKPIPLLVRAAAFAADKHRDQRRKNKAATPYINHPLTLAEILTTEGEIEDVGVIAAAILHDTIEDTETTREELHEQFGERIADIVYEVTDDQRLPKQQRKELQVRHAPHLSEGAKLVKLADKIANLRDVAYDPPHGWDLHRRQEYFDWARDVIDGLRGTHAGLEAAFDAIYASGRPTKPG